MAVTVNLFPVTGVTLPLVSMGGSSFLFTCLAIGIILSVARNVEQLEAPPAVEGPEGEATLKIAGLKKKDLKEWETEKEEKSKSSKKEGVKKFNSGDKNIEEVRDEKETKPKASKKIKEAE
jgi:cell division protein FtsW